MAFQIIIVHNKFVVNFNHNISDRANTKNIRNITAKAQAVYNGQGPILTLSVFSKTDQDAT